MKDISDILKSQMNEKKCSPLYAFLIVEGDNYESLQSTNKQQMADVQLQQFNQLGSGNRRRKSMAARS